MAKVRQPRDSKGRWKKNPEFRTGSGGVVYPLRGTTGWGGQYSAEEAGEGKSQAGIARRAYREGLKKKGLRTQHRRGR